MEQAGRKLVPCGGSPTASRTARATGGGLLLVASVSTSP